ncbi:MAG: universal stress protein [Pyrinomonadaceae bacterium]
MLKSAEILVPVDFSLCSANALRVAVRMAEPDGDVTLLHVIDQQFVQDAEAAGLGTAEEITSRLRSRTEESFTSLLAEIDTGSIDSDRMTVIGVPFIEILKIVRDLDLKMIVMGVKGRSTPPEDLLFGSTAEKVLRGARVPVLVVPY